MTRHFDDPIVVGDCLDTLRGMPDASVDAVVTDDPRVIAVERHRDQWVYVVEDGEAVVFVDVSEYEQRQCQ